MATFPTCQFNEYSSNQPVHVDASTVDLATVREVSALETTAAVPGTFFIAGFALTEFRVMGRPIDVLAKLRACIECCGGIQP